MMVTKTKATLTVRNNNNGKITQVVGFGDDNMEALDYAACGVMKNYTVIKLVYSTEEFQDKEDTRTEEQKIKEQRLWEKRHPGR